MESVGHSHGRLWPSVSRVIEVVANKVLVVLSVVIGTVILLVIADGEASSATVVRGVPQYFTSWRGICHGG